MISGNGSGTSSNADDLVIGGIGDNVSRGISICSGTNGNIRFSDSGDNATGMIEYNHSSNYMRVYVEAGEALRINSNRHLLPGADSLHDLGLTGTRWRNLYADTLYGDGSNLTGLATSADINNLINNIAMLGFKVAVNGTLAKYSLVDQVIDEFNDSSGIDAGASTNESLQGSGTAKYYSGSSTSTSNTNTTYSYDGSDDTLSLSNGQTVTGTIKLWGAAGGTDYSPGNNAHRGGGGAFASATFNYVSDGTNLIFSVGQGGISGAKAGSGGNGGGYSGVFLGSKTHSNALIVVGGGGGGGDSTGYNGAEAGAFGGSGSGAYNGGSGGTQNAGGGFVNPFGAGSVSPTAGSALAGGHGGGTQSRQQSAGYNGGGIQGQEGGGYNAGGGGGAGYYGGGGGAGGNGGSGGGGGSSYYNTGSYWSGTPSSAAGSGGTSGGASDSNYPGGTVGSVTAGSRNDGGHGAIYVDITISTAVTSNMTLQSVDATAQSVPSTADLIMLIEDNAGTATLNTDVKAYISRNSGSTFTQGTLVDEGTWGTSAKRIVAFHNLDISSQSSGTSVCYKIETLNQSASKQTSIHAVSHGWK
tara:strand:+ start:16 stop:1767 length:1752 start_codon:yes stop_codon:yes gene_type:complete